MVKAGIDRISKKEECKLVLEAIVFSIQELKARIERRCKQ